MTKRVPCTSGQEISDEHSDSTVATTIAAQLGGIGRLKAMIGADKFAFGERHLQFRFAARATNGANSVTITLDGSDTYTVTFYRIGRGFSVKEISSIPFVYDDQLRPVFESETGLFLGKIVVMQQAPTAPARNTDAPTAPTRQY